MPSDKQPHLLVCITAHGFGHAAQTVPVLNALHALVPEVRITLRSQVPLSYLRERLTAPFQYLRAGGDIGLLMSSALDVRVSATAAAYQHLHRDWGLRVSIEAHRLREIAPDFVLSNVGYLPLAGAHRAGIPCAGMSSLNWGDIYAHYCGAISGTYRIAEDIRLSYANAHAFLRLTPGLPMPGLHNLLDIDPIAHLGRDRRDEIRAHAGLGQDEKLVLISLGGIDNKLVIDRWPRIPGVRWLVQANWHSAHPDALVLEALDMPFSDVLASADALLCKPGYGSFVEAACAGVPMLYVSRPDWPETPCLKQWLAQHGIGLEISRTSLTTGGFAQELQTLWQSPAPARPQPAGIMQAADWLVRQLSGVP